MADHQGDGRSEPALKLTFCTSFAPHAWEETAKQCVVSANQFWPVETYIFCFWEGARPMSGLLGRNLFEINEVQDFLRRHAKNGEVRGLTEGRIKWGAKAKSYGYNFRTDAYKFARKVFAVSALAPFRSGRFFWVDADVITNQTIPRAFFTAILPDDCDVCYLDRPGYHSELGFVGFNLDHQNVRQLIDAWVDLYATDKFMDIGGGWTDCHTFDYLVKTLKIKAKKIVHSSNAQPFDHSILRNYMVHLKGKRKENSWRQGADLDG